MPTQCIKTDQINLLITDPIGGHYDEIVKEHYLSKSQFRIIRRECEIMYNQASEVQTWTRVSRTTDIVSILVAAAIVFLSVVLHLVAFDLTNFSTWVLSIVLMTISAVFFVITLIVTGVDLWVYRQNRMARLNNIVDYLNDMNVELVYCEFVYSPEVDDVTLTLELYKDLEFSSAWIPQSRVYQ